MFQLIVATVAIVLCSVLAIGAIWYGGEAFAEASSRAKLVGIEMTAQQIDAAIQLYYQDKLHWPTERDDALVEVLVSGNYLMPLRDEGWKISTDELYRPVQTGQCAIINEAAGFGAVCPRCDDEAQKGLPGCSTPD
ncbi:hypothetical protein BB934_45530 (plasmid) [Microvirga ossetica]|uniref:Type II secretion system protein GspG C-terminal domain-containing protein n=1 Tax=Microvirga ossetica TaxID=1882682 RepID=A0A1B2EZW9_9HYPH|nr:hypothetical protein [Microvirga ossetica]ANY85484.1 hypothetical protein BB934_45530 [Microvirga ossetica]